MVQKKIKVILKEQSGISLLFVLAVMLLLMAIAISTLVAASTATGGGITARTEKQMEVYADSVVKAFTKNLQSTNPMDFGMMLPKQIYADFEAIPEESDEVGKAYEKLVFPLDAERTITFEIPLHSDLEKNAKNKEFKLSFPDGVIVSKSPDVPAVTELGIPMLPGVVTIKSFTMILTIETILNSKSIKKEATYRCNGATFTGNPTAAEIDDADFEGWELIRYGKIN